MVQWLKCESGHNNQLSNSRKNSPVICQFCEKKGHVALDCYKIKCMLGLPVPPKANIATTKNNHKTKPNCLLDIGASHHVTVDLNNLNIRQPYKGPDDIIIGDGSGLHITHTGNSTLSTPSNSSSLSNVLCVPTIKQNLILVS